MIGTETRMVTGYVDKRDRHELYIPTMNLCIAYGSASHPHSMQRLDILSERLAKVWKLQLDYWSTNCWIRKKEFNEKELYSYIKENMSQAFVEEIEISFDQANEIHSLLNEYEKYVDHPNTYGIFDTAEKRAKREELEKKIKERVALNFKKYIL